MSVDTGAVIKEELQISQPAQLSTSEAAMSLFWCRDCGRNATEECADMDHVLCSLKRRRLEQEAPELQRLRHAATSARKVVRALQDAKDAVEAQLEEWRARLQRVEEAERELQAAVNEGRDLQAAQMGDLDHLLLLLKDAASLLETRCQLQVQLQNKDGTERKADLQLAASGSGCSILHQLVLLLVQDGIHVKVFRPDECMDVDKLCRQKEHSQELDDVLRDPAGLAKVRKLDSVDCEKRPNWCKVLLQRVVPRVEWLYVGNADREHLDVIQNMPALRYLDVHLARVDTDAPDLPLQLQDLAVANVPAQHLQSVKRMPNLRKLSLERSGDEQIVTWFPPLPPGHRGLQWLQVYLRPASTVLSLAKTHAATLQELRIFCASEGKTPWHFKNLGEGLRQCGLVALRRVVLLRRPAPDFPEKLPHGEKSCQQQKHAVWDKLLVEEDTEKVVKVLCEECDSCPAFPDLGDFTWKDD